MICVAVALLAGTIASCSDATSRQGASAASKVAVIENSGITDVIRAHRIEAATITLRDSAGQKTTTLIPGGMFFEEQGKARLLLLAGPKGGEFQLFNANGPVLGADADKKQEAEKMPAVAIGAAADGGGNIHVYNPLGKRVAILQSNKNDLGVLYVFDGNGDNVKAFGP